MLSQLSAKGRVEGPSSGPWFPIHCDVDPGNWYPWVNKWLYDFFFFKNRKSNLPHLALKVVRIGREEVEGM